MPAADFIKPHEYHAFLTRFGDDAAKWARTAQSHQACRRVVRARTLE
jgi:hypothetical protein